MYVGVYPHPKDVLVFNFKSFSSWESTLSKHLEETSQNHFQSDFSGVEEASQHIGGLAVVRNLSLLMLTYNL